jgi:hypothetical protein
MPVALFKAVAATAPLRRRLDMDLDFLDGLAPELTSWLTHRGGYQIEERPEAVHWATIGLHAAYGDEGIEGERT